MYRVPPTCTNWTLSGTDGTRFCVSILVSVAGANLLSVHARCRYAVCRYAVGPDGFVSGGSDPPGQYRPTCDAVLAETFVSRLAVMGNVRFFYR